jgi:hypothetical protein
VQRFLDQLARVLEHLRALGAVGRTYYEFAQEWAA